MIYIILSWYLFGLISFIYYQIQFENQLIIGHLLLGFGVAILGPLMLLFAWMRQPPKFLNKRIF